MVKGVKFRAYPNKEQQNLINRTLGCSRMIYNKGLSMRNIAYAAGDKIGYNQTSSMLTELKKQEDYAFLKEVDSIALQQSLRDLDRGFKNFFAKRAAHPRFKSKHDHHQSYRTMNQGNNIRITGRYIKLPKLGYIKIRQSMEIGHINHVTIERTPTGKYFSSSMWISTRNSDQMLVERSALMSALKHSTPIATAIRSPIQSIWRNQPENLSGNSGSFLGNRKDPSTVISNGYK